MMFYSCAVVCNIPLGRNTTNTQVEKEVQAASLIYNWNTD